MPKDRRSSSLDRCRASPYSRCQKKADKTRPKSPSRPIGNENEWEEARCPICMEHPHNAVLLLCSSRERGCLPFMCDTSSRHSNCLDQFRKSAMNSNTNSLAQGSNLVCPLCRGQINGWIVINPARHYMNSKTRSCSSSTCDFAGTYSQLRKHARCEHPCVRPTNVDPNREMEWRSLEENMEQEDILNMHFEFDDDDDVVVEAIDEGLMDDVFDLASPIWDYDMDFMNFLSTFESEFENVFPEFDYENGFLVDDLENLFTVSSSAELESRNRTDMNSRRQRSNARRRSHPSSHDHQEQIATLVDFHELRSNRPP